MFALLLVLQGAADGGPTYHGLTRQLDVRIPRIETTVKIDGVLDEPAWSRAALLTGFSQYRPVDGRPAEDSTDVLVWYAPDAIYVGIRAFEPHGHVVRATLADRDNIDADDHVAILLDTYLDHRRADRLEPRLRVRVARPRDRLGLRGGGADSLQESPLSERQPPGLGGSDPALRAALGVRGDLDARGPRQRELSHSVGSPGRPRRPAAWPGARPHTRVHHQGGRRPHHAGVRLSRHARSRGQSALGRHPEPRPHGDRQPGLLAGRGRHRSGDAQPAVRPVLPGEATVLSRGARAVRHAQQSYLHPAHRPAGVRR